jgi:hypothetical protein
VLRESSSEERGHEIEDFVACCFRTCKALQDLRTTGCEEFGAESVFGVVIGVEGEPIKFVETFETHCHPSGGSHSQGSESEWLDVSHRRLMRLGDCGADILKRKRDIDDGPSWKFSSYGVEMQTPARNYDEQKDQGYNDYLHRDQLCRVRFCGRKSDVKPALNEDVKTHKIIH